MSNSIQHKLLEMEVPAPEKCWERIAAELDDAAIGFQFPARLQQLSIAAPAHCWDNISHQLSAEQDFQGVAAKLLIAEVNPPAEIWTAIASKLDPTTKAHSGRRFSLFRYAAAAVILSILIFAGIKLFSPAEKNKQDTAQINPEARQPGNEKNEAGTVVATDETKNLALEDDVKDIAALEATKNTYARLDVPARKRKNMASQLQLANYLLEDDVINHSNTGYEEARHNSNTNIAGRYVMLMTPDGYIIRMSKKLGNLICCVSGEEVDDNCKTQMDTWRKQLAYSEASHPGNFIDILNLVESLQDNQ